MSEPDDHRYPCTPYCSPWEGCSAECEKPLPQPRDVKPEAAELALELSIKLQGALGEQCYGHIDLPSGGGLRCRRVATHPGDRGLFAAYPAEEHVYGVGPDGGEVPFPRTWVDDDMGAISHREWWAFYGEGEMRRRAIESGGDAS